MCGSPDYLQGSALTAQGDTVTKPSEQNSRFPSSYAVDPVLLCPGSWPLCTTWGVDTPSSVKGRAMFSLESSWQLEPPPHPFPKSSTDSTQYAAPSGHPGTLTECVTLNAIEEMGRESACEDATERRIRKCSRKASRSNRGAGRSSCSTWFPDLRSLQPRGLGPCLAWVGRMRPSRLYSL